MDELKLFLIRRSKISADAPVQNEENTQKTGKHVELENILFCNLSDVNYRKLIHLSHESNDVNLKLDSKYKLSRSINSFIQTMKFPNSNYGEKCIPKTLKLQHAREIVRETNELYDHILRNN